MHRRPRSAAVPPFALLVALAAVLVMPNPAAGTVPEPLRYGTRPAFTVAGEADGPGRRTAASRTRDGEGRALASADLDGDGVPDLAVGLATDGAFAGGAGRISIHRGLGWEAPAPFAAAEHVVELPAPPDLLAAGDFDRDGRADLVAASRSDAALWWLAGRGDGGFAPPVEVPLPGAATALAVGWLDDADGLDDLALAVDGPGGAELLVWRSLEPSFSRPPLRLPLPAAAGALVVADLVAGRGHDLAAAVGESLVVLPGCDRLVGGELPAAPDPVVEALAFAPVALAAADPLAGGRDRRDLVLLGTGGELEVRRWDELAEGASLTVTSGATAAARHLAEPSSVRPGGVPPAAAPLLLAVRQEGSRGDGFAVVAPGRGEIEVLALPTADASSGDAWVAAAARGELAPVARRALEVPGAVAALPAWLDGDALTDLVVLTADGAVETVVSALGSVFTVNSTGFEDDASPGDGSCLTSINTCTLPAAIQESEALSGADTIRFSISPGGPTVVPRTIFFPGPLPALTGPLTLEGPNQGGAPIVLDGGNLAGTSGIPALTFDAASSGVVIRRLTIADFPGEAAVVRGSGHRFEGLRLRGNARDEDVGTVVELGGGGHVFGGSSAAQRNVVAGSPGETAILVPSSAGSGIQVLGNHLGLEPSGAVSPFAVGVHLRRGAQVGSSGGGNVIAASGDGIHVAASDARLWGNRVGTSPDGMQSTGTGGTGIRVSTGFDTLIGGAGVGLGNQLAGLQDGIHVHDALGAGDPSDLGVFGNLIGVDATGNGVLANTGHGIYLYDMYTANLGGASTSARNVVGGNAGVGIFLRFVGQTVVQGNHVGVGADGVTPVPNEVGIVTEHPGGQFIGGESAGAGNVIAGNDRQGVLVTGSAFHVQLLGNKVGVAADGSPLGNGLAGVYAFAATGLRIGSVGSPNEIAYNGGNGVTVDTESSGIDTAHNSIHHNGLLGIDLDGDGVTVRRDGQGANRAQAAPELTDVFTDGGSTLLRLANFGEHDDYRISVFSSPACDASGYGEGAVFLGDAEVTVAGFGSTMDEISVDGVAPLGHAVTTVATRLGTGDSSEFSACDEALSCGYDRVQVSLFGGTVTGTEVIEACRFVGLSTNFGVEGGDLTVRAGERVVLGDGFYVTQGGSLRVEVGVR